jgi:fructan beta-fructosidase
LKLQVLLDTSSIEVFANDGEVVFTDLILPAPGSRPVEIEAINAPNLKVGRLDFWDLKSIW